MGDRLIDSPRVRVGLVIGTFAAAPYVHLQLEAVRRFEPGMPVLVHDDRSPKLGRLRELAQEYGHRCLSTPARRSHSYGDLAAMAAGLRWAEQERVEILVKLSRRFLPLYAWSEDLGRLACRLQYATYSSPCAADDLGFRTECLAFHAPSWRSTGAVDRIEEESWHREAILVESFVHGLARLVHTRVQCAQNRRLEDRFPKAGNVSAYGDWWIGGASRRIPDPEVLWHDRNSPEDYAMVA